VFAKPNQLKNVYIPFTIFTIFSIKMSLGVIVNCNHQGLTQIIPCQSVFTSQASLAQDSQASSTGNVSSQLSKLSKSEELFVFQKWKEWVDLLGKRSAEAQFLKEPITCSSKFINGKSHSPFQHKDRIYLLIQINDKKKNGGKELDDGLQPIGLLRVGRRNLFFEDDGQLVNINQCFSVLGNLLDFVNKYKQFIN